MPRVYFRKAERDMYRDEFLPCGSISDTIEHTMRLLLSSSIYAQTLPEASPHVSTACFYADASTRFLSMTKILFVHILRG